MRTIFPAFLAAALFLPGPGRADPVGYEEFEQDGKACVALENDLYRLVFNPGRGGRCSSFRLKATDRELVYDGKTAGFFQDHFAHQGYPGELLEAAYDYEVTRDGDQAVSIRLWTAATGAGGRDPLTQGIEVMKTITLTRGHRAVDIVNAFHNPTDRGKNVGMWVQHCFAYGGRRLFDAYYRPSTHGIHVTGKDDKGHGHLFPAIRDTYSADWVGKSKYSQAGGREPVAGWTAGHDRRSLEGGVFLMDYNYLAVLYNSANSRTTEWWLDPVPLPPGKSWNTRYRFIPVNGFTGFTHAGDSLIANTRIEPGETQVALRHQLAGTTEPPGELRVQTRLWGIRSGRETALETLVVTGVGLEPVTVLQTWDQPQTEPLVARVTIGGRGFEEAYEVLHEGAFAAVGIDGAGEQAEYLVPRPRKEKVFLRPDSWERPRNLHPKVLVLYGLWTHHYRIEDAIEALDPRAEITLSPNWDLFPPTYDALLQYDVIVLSNVPVGPDYANVMLGDAVRHAGVGLLCLGGMATYGGGQWRESHLLDVLPATLSSAFDMQRSATGLHPQVAAHPAVIGVRFPDNARFWWRHDLRSKPNASVVVESEGKPLAIADDVGSGRVVVIAATCHGEPGENQVAAWTTPAWRQLLTQTMTWLMERK